ncbi:DISARM system helicase DrmA [Mesotoga sp. Brook.08.YT.4.2.5.1]|uniref:DISARM system helicase DrmA n=1 Tax=Mesotoga sp. Brook.08.YT.4.2.5.1 TaxID=1421001 RepID=UPI001CA4D998|nr:DISARM system helicase DrmA [Mesotoga sp. Brook.08.YT.4.2.5.1]
MCSSVWKEIDWQSSELKSLNLSIPFVWSDGAFLLGSSSQEYEKFSDCDLRSEFLPIHLIVSPTFDWPEEISPEPELDTEELSELSDAESVEAALSPIINGYKKWLERSFLDVKEEMALSNVPQGWTEHILEQIVHENMVAIDRMKRSMEILKTDDNVLLSFCFAMKAMNLQARWKKKRKLGDKTNRETPFLRWRPFQLAFILLTLESIVEPNSEYRKTCDLLWIPTGGGKTEAYLAIAAFTIAHRRRKALIRGRNGGGTTVISRYTLRLLTIQQYRRALSAITACELLRVYERDNGKRGWCPSSKEENEDILWGSIPFEIGLWVGTGVTPNKIQSSIDVLSDKEGLPEYSTGEPAQVVRCPSCGSILSIPKDRSDSPTSVGLPKDIDHTMFFLVGSQDNIKPNILPEEISTDECEVKSINFLSTRSEKHWIMVVVIRSDRTITKRTINDWWHVFRRGRRLTLMSLSPSNPGYYSTNDTEDFHIICNNPDCDLNRKWFAGIPVRDGQGEVLADGYSLYDFETTNEKYKCNRIPIPALTCDEQIYNHCPSMVVATVDKFARLPFEPKTASLFGNVSRWNNGTCYSRGGTTGIKIEAFGGPELIIQDELHLIDGPLGSLVGLYESAVDILCEEANESPVKYLASSATVKNAEDQVKALFNRNMALFPPHGFEAEVHFFVRERETSVLDDGCPGRLYIGVAAPGLGPHTPIVNIWTALLSAKFEIIQNDKEEMPFSQMIDPYSTVIGYFNAIRELAGARTLYQQDIPEKFKYSNGETAENDFSNLIELSSRRSSTELPFILEDLEKNYPDNTGALFATSMFGTGVDISRLGLMVVNGQPKNTSIYIQATGRVGRSAGGLIITFLRASRPRDLNHYEFFCAYHNQLYRFVEPATVMPFSPGAIENGIGPVIVSVLRNMRNDNGNDWRNNPSLMNNGKNFSEVKRVCDAIIERAKSQPQMRIPVEKDVKECIIRKLEEWAKVAFEAANEKEKLFYNSYDKYRKPNFLVLGDLKQSNDFSRHIAFGDTPQSLREVEGTFRLQIDGGL